MKLKTMCHECGEDASPAASSSWVGGKVARTHLQQQTLGVTTTYSATTTYSEVVPFEVRICERCFRKTVAEKSRTRLQQVKWGVLVACVLAAIGAAAGFINQTAQTVVWIVCGLVVLWLSAYALGALRMRSRPAPRDVEEELHKYARSEARKQGFDTIWTLREYERGGAGYATR